MPHLRFRNALESIKRLARIWPIVGVTGMRQVGKSTLLRELLQCENLVSMDDDDSKTDAENAPRVFFAKYSRPLVIDEVQKVPKLFDAMKSEVDKKRIPGTFYITGSQSFTVGEQTRESLTGRIGSLRLYPMTLRESLGAAPALSIDAFARGMQKGGLPVPMFLRDEESRRLYWDGWLETTLIRDLARAHGKGYDLDFAKLVLKELANQLSEGRYAEISGFSKDSRKVMRYLKTMESIYLIQRIPCHDAGTGYDHWIMGDSGLAAHLIGNRTKTEQGTLTLARHYLYNEIVANREYELKRSDVTYFKSSRGEPVDFVVENVPMKVLIKSSGPTGWDEKGVWGAMKKLNSKRGLLLAPIEKSDPVKKAGISRASWLHFS